MMREVNGMLVVDALLREHGMIAPDEVWVHGMWTPDKWAKCIRAKLDGKKLVRMTHGSLSPVYLARQGKWKKRLVKPVERLLFAISDRMVCTGPWEVEWARKWGYKGKIQVIDLKQFFDLRPECFEAPPQGPTANTRYPFARTSQTLGPLHVLYLGRVHPLKGIEYLRKAVEGVKGVELREVSDHFDAELEEDWKWCDVLCLPTLSENFGLVVAESLQRGIPAITTDGAPAWEGQQGVTYLKGYREGTDEERVQLLRDALEKVIMCEKEAGK